MRKRKNHLLNYGNNSWVLITGASQGVGKTFAEEFARLGFNIIIVSRDLDKLKKCEESIKNITKTSKILCIPFDFSKKVTLEEYQESFGEAFKLDISILINNIGIRDVRKYKEFSLEQVYNICVVNTIPSVILTRMLIDSYTLREKRSAIINISSSSSVYPLPYFVLYSSTKVFNDYFSRGLSYELQDKVDILSAKPFFINSSTVNLSPNGVTVISTTQFVNSILDQLGYERETNGYWTHQAMGAIFKNIVEYIQFYVVYQLMRRKRHSLD